MGGGITILLIAAIGAGYFLYQKFSSGNRERFNNVFRRIFGNRNHNANTARQYRTQNNPQPIEQMRTVQNARSANGQPLVPASRDNITETGPMVYFANDRHGQNDKEYRFNYKKVGGVWRAYILRMPSLGNRSSDSAMIHRLRDGNSYYICWDRPVNTLKDMQIISRRWADSIQDYIYTGRFG